MGLRLGYDMPKALVKCAGEPLLARTLKRFLPLGLIEGAIITAPAGHEQQFREALRNAIPDKQLKVITGGASRQESVALAIAQADSDTEIIVIHDAARPFVDPASVQASIDAARKYGAATVAIPSSDTILVADDSDFLMDTPDRNMLWACQTPQTFRLDVIKAAHHKAAQDKFAGTDDASLAQRMGNRVKLVQGTALNFKVTTAGDLALATAVAEKGLVV